MNIKIIYTIGLASLLGLSACVEKQPIDPRYYHQTQGIPYQNGEESPFTKEEIEQAKRDEEALSAALANQSSQVDTARWQNEIRRICVSEMGFPYGTANYTRCYSFYNDQARLYGIDVNAITLAEIDAFLLWTHPIIRGCRGYGYLGDALWRCAYHGEYRHHHYWRDHHPHHPAPHHGGPAPHGGHGGPAPHANPAPHGGHGGPGGGHGSPAPHGGHGGSPAPHGGNGGAPHGGPKH